MYDSDNPPSIVANILKIITYMEIIQVGTGFAIPITDTG